MDVLDNLSSPLRRYDDINNKNRESEIMKLHWYLYALIPSTYSFFPLSETARNLSSALFIFGSISRAF